MVEYLVNLEDEGFNDKRIRAVSQYKSSKFVSLNNWMDDKRIVSSTAFQFMSEKDSFPDMEVKENHGRVANIGLRAELIPLYSTV